MKMKHGQKAIFYTPSDYSAYNHHEQYIHPTIYIGTCRVVDAIESLRHPGYREQEHHLKKARALREATGNTLHIEKTDSFGNELTLKWQSHREGHSGECWYPSLYSCKIDTCGFNSEILAIASKLAKLVEHGWNAQPLQVVEALKKIKAICIVWNKQADSFIFADHLADDMFGLPEHLRQNDRVFA